MKNNSGKTGIMYKIMTKKINMRNSIKQKTLYFPLPLTRVLEKDIFSLYLSFLM